MSVILNILWDNISPNKLVHHGRPKSDTGNFAQNDHSHHTVKKNRDGVFYLQHQTKVDRCFNSNMQNHRYTMLIYVVKAVRWIWKKKAAAASTSVGRLLNSEKQQRVVSLQSWKAAVFAYWQIRCVFAAHSCALFWSGSSSLTDLPRFCRCSCPCCGWSAVSDWSEHEYHFFIRFWKLHEDQVIITHY